MTAKEIITMIATNSILQVEELDELRHRTKVINKIAESVVEEIFSNENKWIAERVRYDNYNAQTEIACGNVTGIMNDTENRKSVIDAVLEKLDSNYYESLNYVSRTDARYWKGRADGLNLARMIIWLAAERQQRVAANANK